ncbi:MAG: YwaF family protein, partial [Christensenellaceae bacterium]|nr:YwaF family protein [Christensenellaceae bacterium]
EKNERKILKVGALLTIACFLVRFLWDKNRFFEVGVYRNNLGETIPEAFANLPFNYAPILTGGGMQLNVNKLLTAFSLLAYTAGVALFLVAVISVFYKNGLTKYLLVYFGIPTSVFMLAMLPWTIQMVSGYPSYSMSRPDLFYAPWATIEFQTTAALGRSVVYAAEIMLTTVLVVWQSYKFCFETGKFRLPKFTKQYALMFAAAVPVIIALCVSHYIPRIFGGQTSNLHLDDLKTGQGSGQRILMYFGLLSPIVTYYVIRKRSHEAKMAALLFISYSTLITYISNWAIYEYTEVTSLPLHLCNTAMYVMPLCLTFKWKRLFYFTYFINVLGAFFAWFIPSAGESGNLFNPNVMTYWINHWPAASLPLVIVAVGGIFDRPKIKQFKYSIIFFTAYMLSMLIINPVFTSIMQNRKYERYLEQLEAGRRPDETLEHINDSSSDYFFLNQGRITDALHWGNLRNLVYEWYFKDGKFVAMYRNTDGYDHATMTKEYPFEQGYIRFELRPIYHSLFYITYFGMMIGMWFLYSAAFAWTKRYSEMNEKKRGIKLDRLAFEAMLNGRPEREPLYEDETNMLTIKNFSKMYGTSNVYAVDNVSIEVNGGEVFGFLGPNGAGKSTIIKSIVGIQPITEGTIAINGFDIQRQPGEAKMNIGFVPDHYAFYERLTGREYINYIADLYKVDRLRRTEIINDLLAKFSLKEAFDNPIRTYSHGMKQKIAIMSALVHEPKLWILDEPLTGLDPDSIFQVKEAMKEHAKKGNIVFFSTHIMDVAERLCDRVAVIKFGHLIYQGTMDDVTARGTTLEVFYRTLIAETVVTPRKADQKNATKVKNQYAEENS